MSKTRHRPPELKRMPDLCKKTEGWLQADQWNTEAIGNLVSREITGKMVWIRSHPYLSAIEDNTDVYFYRIWPFLESSYTICLMQDGLAGWGYRNLVLNVCMQTRARVENTFIDSVGSSARPLGQLPTAPLKLRALRPLNLHYENHKLIALTNWIWIVSLFSIPLVKLRHIVSKKHKLHN